MGERTTKLDLDELTAAETPADEDDAAQPLPASAADDAAPRPPGVGKSDDLGAVYDIPVQLSAVLGKTTMPVSQLLRLGRGAVVELDRKVGEPIDILVNNRLVARGEVVILDDRLGVTMTEIIKSET
jgi:flagellar motor switch protein FliN/FliY